MYDVIIENGIIADGTGARPYRGAVCFRGGKITKIIREGSGEKAEATETYDAGGHIVAPGFVNIHCHSDNTYKTAPDYESMLTSGVTFELCGQCGLSCVPLCGKSAPQHGEPADMPEYAGALEKTGISINVGMSTGHGALRAAIAGWEQRPLTPAELAEMCALLDRELKSGSMGVSFGLIYPPGSFCDTQEIKALARVCAENGKLLSVHMRNENRHVFEALDEMLDVARETGVRLEISHLKLMGKTMWGRSGELLAKIDMARAKGISIHCDQYPYDASHSRLTSSLPGEALDGGYEALVKNLKDEAWWDRISCRGTLPEMDFRGGAENIIINELIPEAEHPEYIGMSIAEIARKLGCSDAEAVRQVLLSSGGRVQCIYHNMAMEDVLNIMSRRDVSVVSDGTAFSLKNSAGLPHPRNTGTFARFFRLVRENSLMPIEDAVYKVSGLPSTVIGTDDRFGFIKEGLDATVTVFDKDTITDKATYENPALPSEGIDFVFVNGVKVLERGQVTAARPGRCILSR